MRTNLQNIFICGTNKVKKQPHHFAVSSFISILFAFNRKSIYRNPQRQRIKQHVSENRITHPFLTHAILYPTSLLRQSFNRFKWNVP